MEGRLGTLDICICLGPLEKKKNTLCQAANNHISFLFPSLISHECYTFEDTVITVCAPTLRIVPRRLVFVAKSASTTSQVPNRSTGQIMQHKLEQGLSIFFTNYVHYSWKDKRWFQDS
jgi:hypothetical protein